MTDIKSANAVFGYISAYLTRPLRSLDEAQRDIEAQQRLDHADANAAPKTADKPRS